MSLIWLVLVNQSSRSVSTHERGIADTPVTIFGISTPAIVAALTTSPTQKCLGETGFRPTAAREQALEGLRTEIPDVHAHVDLPRERLQPTVTMAVEI